jgi:hypothetical protein
MAQLEKTSLGITLAPRRRNRKYLLDGLFHRDASVCIKPQNCRWLSAAVRAHVSDEIKIYGDGFAVPVSKVFEKHWALPPQAAEQSATGRRTQAEFIESENAAGLSYFFAFSASSPDVVVDA